MKRYSTDYRLWAVMACGLGIPLMLFLSIFVVGGIMERGITFKILGRVVFVFAIGGAFFAAIGWVFQAILVRMGGRLPGSRLTAEEADFDEKFSPEAKSDDSPNPGPQ